MPNSFKRKLRKFFSIALLTFSATAACWAGPLKCDLGEYKTRAGLTATLQGEVLVVDWAGDSGSEVRAGFAVNHGVPTIRDLALREGAAWTTLGENLTPEFWVTSGVRRMSEQQAAPLRALGVEITPEVIEKNKWYAFWDAPLEVPGTHPGEKTPRDRGLPRNPEEIHRARASFHAESCAIKTGGDRIEINFPGLEMGIFSGSLRFIVYRG